MLESLPTVFTLFCRENQPLSMQQLRGSAITWLQKHTKKLLPAEQGHYRERFMYELEEYMRAEGTEPSQRLGG